MTEKDILFQDRHLVACLKAPGLLSETGGMPELLADLIGGSVYCVHRLDRAVGGVMVYARTKEAAAALSGAIAAGKMKKRYLAVVCGRPQEKETVWRDLLYHDAERNKSYVVKRMRRGVREAELSYTLVDVAERRRRAEPAGHRASYRPKPSDPGAVCLALSPPGGRRALRQPGPELRNRALVGSDRDPASHKRKGDVFFRPAARKLPLDGVYRKNRISDLLGKAGKE